MNAKQEFLEAIERRSLLCALVEGSDNDRKMRPDFKATLKVGYSQEDFEDFLNTLDFDYDNGYGKQELFGIIWFTDGAWAERGEYNGFEWWAYQACPEIPIQLSAKEPRND